MQNIIDTEETLSKSDYKIREQELRLKLLQLQFKASKKNKSVIIVIAGDDRTGRHETINQLTAWLDPRFIRVNAYGPSEKLDEQKPFFWRYWRDLPAAGHLGIYLREWTSTSIVQFLNNDISKKKLAKRITNIVNFEKALTDDGALIIKFWLHLPKAAHKKRLKKVRNTVFYDEKDELAFKNYNVAINTIEDVLEQTDTPEAPWFVLNSHDEFQRNIQVGTMIEQQLNHWIDADQTQVPPTAQSLVMTDDQQPLSHIDLTQCLSKEEYEEEFVNCQRKLRKLMTKAQAKQRSVICMFEGVDAAGKGGAIRRLVSSLDAGQYRIIPIAKPNDDEYAHHYLWRFWRHIPGNGMMTIFDRSWYGRVLVERVEGFAKPEEWQRAYQEINDFEQQLSQHGTILVKYWLHIDQDEQLKRFQARENTPHKLHKITDEDYRNREKWPQYEVAIDDMIVRSDSKAAGWSLIAAQDKRYARIPIYKALIAQLKKHL